MIKTYALSATVRHWRYDARRASRDGARRDAAQALAAREWMENGPIETATLDALA